MISNPLTHAWPFYRNWPRNFFRISAILIATSLFACSNDAEPNKVDFLKEDLILESVSIDSIWSAGNKNDRDWFLTSFDVDESMSIITFDKLSGRLLKFDKNGNLEASTGGIGKGPNEHLVDESKIELQICSSDFLVTVDWESARFNIYNTNLDYKRSVSLSGTPFNVECVSPDEVLIFYTSSNSIELINSKGQLINTFKFDSSTPNSFGNFKRLIPINNSFVIGYYFDKNLILYNRNNGIEKVINMPFPDSENPNVPVVVTRSLEKLGTTVYLHTESKPFELEEPGNLVHLFNKNLEYLKSFTVPLSFKEISILNDSTLIVLEDDYKSINMYRIAYE